MKCGSHALQVFTSRREVHVGLRGQVCAMLCVCSVLVGRSTLTLIGQVLGVIFCVCVCVQFNEENQVYLKGMMVMMGLTLCV